MFSLAASRTPQGYALIEFETSAEAKTAIHACETGLTLMDQELKADFAFVRPPTRAADKSAAASSAATGRKIAGSAAAARARSQSPSRR